MNRHHWVGLKVILTVVIINSGDIHFQNYTGLSTTISEYGFSFDLYVNKDYYSYYINKKPIRNSSISEITSNMNTLNASVTGILLNYSDISTSTNDILGATINELEIKN